MPYKQALKPVDQIEDADGAWSAGQALASMFTQDMRCSEIGAPRKLRSINGKLAALRLLDDLHSYVQHLEVE